MRTAKSNEASHKSSAYKGVNRLEADPLPMTIYSNNYKLQVYIGCGWATGIVVYSDETRCNVFLTKEQRVVSCTDNRNLALPQNDKSKD